MKLTMAALSGIFSVCRTATSVSCHDLAIYEYSIQVWSPSNEVWCACTDFVVVDNLLVDFTYSCQGQIEQSQGISCLDEDNLNTKIRAEHIPNPDDTAPSDEAVEESEVTDFRQQNAEAGHVHLDRTRLGGKIQCDTFQDESRYSKHIHVWSPMDGSWCRNEEFALTDTAITFWCRCGGAVRRMDIPCEDVYAVNTRVRFVRDHQDLANHPSRISCDYLTDITWHQRRDSGRPTVAKQILETWTDIVAVTSSPHLDMLPYNAPKPAYADWWELMIGNNNDVANTSFSELDLFSDSVEVWIWSQMQTSWCRVHKYARLFDEATRALRDLIMFHYYCGETLQHHIIRCDETTELNTKISVLLTKEDARDLAGFEHL
eukprot:TRINITY_DN90453_c0_g1_i1.p1 TRINITY_DN90453_c0_g1~~TRINITY_DN90453_c0_g1_i1.p1  ORF type:complete len:374 (+),score=36.98 TRINITY_DN90453_c0_g1_i1:99-1220(+)